MCQVLSKFVWIKRFIQSHSGRRKWLVFLYNDCIYFNCLMYIWNLFHNKQHFESSSSYTVNYEKVILGAAMDDTQRMMQMSGFGMDPTKVNIVSLYCIVF